MNDNIQKYESPGIEWYQTNNRNDYDVKRWIFGQGIYRCAMHIVVYNHATDDLQKWWPAETRDTDDLIGPPPPRLSKRLKVLD